MRDHEQFGKSANLRPRTAGAMRAYSATTASSHSTNSNLNDTNSAPPAGRPQNKPEALAYLANSTAHDAAIKLSERLQLSRPGSASPARTPQLPVSTSRNNTGPPLKPPMRPKSSSGTVSRLLSRHRMERVQASSNNNLEYKVTDTPATATAVKQDDIRTSSTTSQLGSSRSTLTSVLGPASVRNKRPNSAMPASIGIDTNQQSEESAATYAELYTSTTGMKRPHSAAARIVQFPKQAKVITRESASNIQAKSVPSGTIISKRKAVPHLTASAMAIMGSDHRHTFVYAVPLHCLETGLQYNPYNIVTISHEALFSSSGDSGSYKVQDAKHDFYTISAAGFTFHAKNDQFQATFISSADWERQKRQFERICQLSIFQLFRYRKVFLSWKKWIREEKMQYARMHLLSTSYFSHPTLRRGMQAIQRELIQLDKIQLLWNFEGASISFTEFSNRNMEYLQTQTVAIAKISANVTDILRQVCQECLDSMQSPFGGFPGHEFALSTRKSSNFHIFESYVERERSLARADEQFLRHEHFHCSPKKSTANAASLSPSKAAQLRMTHKRHMERVFVRQQQRPENELDEIRWTLAAIRRRKCEHLAKFVRLIDFLQLDAMVASVFRSIESLYYHLLMGANASHVQLITNRDDYLLAFHRTRQASRNTGGLPTAEGLTLTKQQTKRFLRSAWEGKFAAILNLSRNMEENASSTTVWIESKLETFFFQALDLHLGDANGDVFLVDDLLFVGEHSLQNELLLPEFRATQSCILKEVGVEKTEIGKNDAKIDPEGDEEKESAGDIQSIECLAPVPLFYVTLKLVELSKHQYSITFDPPLDQVESVIKACITAMVEVFRDIPALLGHPELQAVISFADDIRSASIHITHIDEEGAHSPDNDNNAGNNGNDIDNKNPRNTIDRFLERIEGDFGLHFLQTEIMQMISSALSSANAFVRRYSELLMMHRSNELFDFEQMQHKFRVGSYSLADMKKDATKFHDQIRTLETLAVTRDVDFLRFDMIQLKNALLPSPTRCLTMLQEIFPQLLHERCDKFLAFVRNACRRIQKPKIPDLDLFVQYLLHLRDVYEEVDEQESELTFLHDFHRVMKRLTFVVPMQTMERFDLCDPEFQALKAQISEANAKKETDIKEYAPMLTECITTLSKSIEELKSNSSDHNATAMDGSSQDARAWAAELRNKAEMMNKESKRLLWIQGIVGDVLTGIHSSTECFSELATISQELQMKNDLWDAVCECDEYLRGNSHETLRHIDVPQVVKIVERMEQVIATIQQSSLQIPALKRLEATKAMMENLAPVIRDLRNEHLEKRHWAKLEHKLNCSFMIKVPEISNADESSNEITLSEVKYLDLPLQHLLDTRAINHAALIHQVSEEATAEAAIAKSFESVLHTWEVKKLPTSMKKDRDGREVHCIGDCTEICALLEESEVLLRVMDLSSYARLIQTRLAQLLGDLAYTKESVELLLICQQKWEYMQHLVSADFVRTFPEAAKTLQKHDSSWRTLMETLSKRPLCLPFGVSSENRQTLQTILRGFEIISNSLTEHLELKRQVFPAFFRLSNFELATLLSKCRDLKNVHQFLYQCFDNVGQIVFGARDAFQDILSITSRAYPQAEVIHLGKNLKARGPLEQWLATLEKRLSDQLRRATKDVMASLSQVTTDTDNIEVIAQPLQSILLADRIVQCELIANCLGEKSMAANQMAQYERIRASHATYHRQLLEQLQLEHLFGSVGNMEMISTRNIVLRSCLILQNMQFRDAVASHFQVSAGSSNFQIHSGPSHGNVDVNWEMQLKYRWDDSTTVGHECYVEMNGLKVPYGFNYSNPQVDMVFTPGSMRSLVALFASIRGAQACVLRGPPECGKTTISRQVSSILGRQHFATQVTAASSYAHVAKLLRGALYSGGTFCVQFAQATSASLTIIRSLSSMLTLIEHAFLTKMKIAGLQNDPIQFIPGTAFLLTYRTSGLQMSQNDKGFQRCMEPLSQFSVMLWDEIYIVEALLSSQGFKCPQYLANQLMLVYHQLNVYKCWPNHRLLTLWGIKKIIASTAAKVLQRGEELETDRLQAFLLCEELLKSFADVVENFSTDNNSNTVEYILNQVFQNREHHQEWFVKRWKRDELKQGVQSLQRFEKYLVDAAKALHLVPRRALIESAHELATSLTGSVGVVLLGDAGVGKTTTYQVLAKAFDFYKETLVSSRDIAKPTSVPAVAASENLQPQLPLPSNIKSDLTKPKQNQANSFVNVQVVLPMALTCTQLYGSTSPDGKGRTQSLLGRLVRQAQESYSPVAFADIAACSCAPALAEVGEFSLLSEPTLLLMMQSLMWVVLDGPLEISWMEGLMCILRKRHPFTLMDNLEEEPARRLLTFEDGEFMTIPPNLRFIFETMELSNASPAFIHLNTIIHFPEDQVNFDDEPNESITKTDSQDDSAMPIHIACICRFLLLYRQSASTDLPVDATGSDSSKPPLLALIACDHVELQLLNTQLLSKIFAVIQEYHCAVPLSILQRVTNMLSLLPPLLHKVSSLTRSDDASEAAIRILKLRINMVIVYALLWGFACCTNDTVTLQILISGMLKSQFCELDNTWTGCGKDVNLFETTLDLDRMRFVHVSTSNSAGGHSSPLAGSAMNDSSSPSLPLSSLFIPTPSSMLTHAVMKHAIRSGRGVLLIGNDDSRKTTLLRNFLSQIEGNTKGKHTTIPTKMKNNGTSVLSLYPKQLLPSAGSSSLQITTDNTEKNATFSFVDRIRFHQIALVRKLAKKLRRRAPQQDTTTPPTMRTQPTSTTEHQNQLTSHLETSHEPGWHVDPTLDRKKASMISKFDRGAYVPFFFTMSRHEHDTSELAKCLERMLQRERTGIYEPPPGKTAVLIIDDLHLPTEREEQDSSPSHPACLEYLRSVYEHSSVYSGNSCALISIENLMLIASIATRSVSDSLSTKTARRQKQQYSLDKLVGLFFPVLAPSCSRHEIQTIFTTLVLAQWERHVVLTSLTSSLERLPHAVKNAIPLFVAGTTILWERFRQASDISKAGEDTVLPHVQLSLHDHSRVYEGICSVEPSFVTDVESLRRLWQHECLQTFSDRFASNDEQYQTFVTTEIVRIGELMDTIHLDQGKDELASLFSTCNASAAMSPAKSASSSVPPRSMDMALSSPVKTGKMNGKFLGKPPVSSSSVASSTSSQQTMGLWAFVPNTLYYQKIAREGGSASTYGGEKKYQRSRSSIAFLQRRNTYSSSDKAVRWIYAEIFTADSQEDTINQAIQILFGAIRVYSNSTTWKINLLATSSMEQEFLASLQLPKNAPPVTLSLAQRIAHIDRVYARIGSKLILLGEPGSGRDILLRYVCSSRTSQQPQSIVELHGIVDAEVVSVKWRLLLRDIYERIGIGCEHLTLVVKRIDLIPLTIMSQLMDLLTLGEIPGAFTLEEQIQLATRVRDERLVELDNQYYAQIARIREELEIERQQGLIQLRKDEQETRAVRKASLIQELERTFEKTLAFRLSQAQLRYQQECDDLLRKCEVETESVTATIMSLMRPLGQTSGKWQKIVQRIRKWLRVVSFVDVGHHAWILRQHPELFTKCDIVSVSKLDEDSLCTIVYGSLQSELQNLLHSPPAIAVNEDKNTSKIHKWNELVEFLEHVQQDLPQMARMVAAMHFAAENLSCLSIPTQKCLIVASFFPRMLLHHYQQETDEVTKANWFLFVYERMIAELRKLEDGQDELRKTLTDCEKQVMTYQTTVTVQKEDAERSRDMMTRFQAAAEEQVRITNAMEAEAQVELHVPLTCLEEANRALLLIDKRHIVEIKSFNSPPLLVHLVLDAICVMFGLEPTWENARKLLGDANAVQNMLNYDKDNVSNSVLSQLETRYMNDPRFNRDEVEKQSVAASMMVVWVRAIYQYASTRRLVKPTLDKLEKSQARLRLLMQEFQSSKDRVNEADGQYQKAKTALEDLITRKQKTLLEIESRAARVESGKLLFNFLAEDKKRMEMIATEAQRQRRYGVTWWNALFSAGFLGYTELFTSNRRRELFKSWKKAFWKCYGTMNTDSVEFVFIPSLALVVKEKGGKDDNEEEESEDDEDDRVATLFHQHPAWRNHWKLVSATGVYFSACGLQNAYFLSQVMTAGFPVVIIANYTHEMEQLLAKCARNLWHWNQFYMIDAKASEFNDMFYLAVQEGHQLLVLDVEPLDGERNHGKLSMIFQWETRMIEGKQHLVIQQERGKDNNTDDTPIPPETLPIHPSFRLILTTHNPMNTFGESLARFPTLDAHMNHAEVQDFILDRMWNPGMFPDDHKEFPLKNTIRNFEQLAREEQTNCDTLTQMIQDAAVRGDFQLQETESMRDKCNTIKAIRLQMQKARNDLEIQIAQVDKQSRAHAKLGGVLLNAFNESIASTVDSINEEETIPSPPLTLQLFIPMFFNAVRQQSPMNPNASATLMSRKSSSTMLDATTKPSPPPSGSSPASLGAGQRTASNHGLRRLPSRRQSSSVFFFNSTSEALRQLLMMLMPLIPSKEDWYRFLIRVIMNMEETQPSALSAINYNLLEEVGEGDKPKDETESSVINPFGDALDIQAALLRGKLARLNVHCTDQDLQAILLPKYAREESAWVPVILNGMDEHVTNGSSCASVAFFTQDRSRYERIRIGLAIFPALLRCLCDQWLDLYGIKISFSIYDEAHSDRTGQTIIRDASISSLSRQNSQQNVTLENNEATTSTTHANIKHGWLRAGSAFPELACILVISKHAFHSFPFLLRVFFHTTFRKEVRLHLLKQIVSKTFQGPGKGMNEFQPPIDLFTLPRINMDKNSTFVVEKNDNIIMLSAFGELLQAEKDRLELLEASPLVLINMQKRVPNSQVDQSDTKHASEWEEFVQILHRNFQQMTSTMVRRYAIVNSTPTLTRQPSEQPSSPRARRPLTRRMSILQRQSNASVVTPSYPRLIGVTESWQGIPIHLRKYVVCLHEQEDNGRSIDLASIKKCIQATIFRVVYHPCAPQLEAAVDSNVVLNRLADQLNYYQIPTVWQLLSSLVLFHALLMFRWQALASFYENDVEDGTISVTSYGFDVFTTALNQLLAVIPQLSQLKPTTEVAIFAAIHDHVVLSIYSRRATGLFEVEVLKLLFRECFNLMQGSRSSRGDTSSSGSANESNYFLQAQHNVTARRINVGLRQSSHSVSRPSTTASTSPSSVFMHSGSGITTTVTTSSPLMCLKFPVERLATTVSEMDQWLELWWEFTDGVESDGLEEADKHLGEMFGVSAGRDYSKPVARTSFSITSVSPVLLELLDWESPSGGADATQAMVTNALGILRIIASEIVPESIVRDTFELTGMSEYQQQQVEETGTDIVSSPMDSERKLFLDLVETTVTSFQQQTQCVHQYVSKTISILNTLELHQKSDENTSSRKQNCKKSAIDEQTHHQIVDILENRIPNDLKQAITTNCEHQPWIDPIWSLHKLVIHYRLWGKFLQREAEANRMFVWWLPAIPPSVPIAHLLRLAKQHYCSTRSLDSHVFSVVFSLQLSADEDLRECIEGDTNHIDQFPEQTIAVFDGLCLIGAKWNIDNGYLDKYDPGSLMSEHQRVKVICMIEPQDTSHSIRNLQHDRVDHQKISIPAEEVPSILTPTPQQHPPFIRKHRQHVTRMCPLLSVTRGNSKSSSSGGGSNVVFEWEFPIVPAFDPFQTPFLTYIL